MEQERGQGRAGNTQNKLLRTAAACARQVRSGGYLQEAKKHLQMAQHICLWLAHSSGCEQLQAHVKEQVVPTLRAMHGELQKAESRRVGVEKTQRLASGQGGWAGRAACLLSMLHLGQWSCCMPQQQQQQPAWGAARAGMARVGNAAAQVHFTSHPPHPSSS